MVSLKILTEELAHLEMVSTIVHQLTCNLSLEEIQNSGFANYYVDHTTGIWPQAAGGVPFNSCEFQSKGDPLTDLFEDLAAEQKARSTYDNILRLVKDPEVADPIRFLRAREVVHFQRFGEALCGLNVLVLLASGTVLSSLAGVLTNGMSFKEVLFAIGQGSIGLWIVFARWNINSQIAAVKLRA